MPPRPVDELFREGGMPALEAIPGIGESLARAIRDVIETGRLHMLERLRGDADPETLLATVPGIGRKTAGRLHHDLDIETLEDLEAAAHDGRLETLAGLGPKRLAGIRESLAQRLGRVRPPAPQASVQPTVAELLDIDVEYRSLADAGALRLVAPRRLNTSGEAWLPVLHTHRSSRHYTARAGTRRVSLQNKERIC